MRIGDLVTWNGRTFRLLGFDPMSMAERRAHLEDPATGERLLVPVDEVEECDPPPAG